MAVGSEVEEEEVDVLRSWFGGGWCWVREVGALFVFFCLFFCESVRHYVGNVLMATNTRKYTRTI